MSVRFTIYIMVFGAGVVTGMLILAAVLNASAPEIQPLPPVWGMPQMIA